MKKLSTRILAVAAALAVLAVLAPVPAAHAADGVPVSITMTLPGGSSNVGTNATYLTYSNVYSVGISSSARSTLQPKAAEYTFAGVLGTSVTATVTFARAAAGPTYESFAVVGTAATNQSGAYFFTNTWYWIRNDRVYVSCSATNSGTVKPTCLEQ